MADDRALLEPKPRCAQCAEPLLLEDLRRNVGLCKPCYCTGGDAALLRALRAAFHDNDDAQAAAIFGEAVRSAARGLIEEIVDEKLDNHRRRYEHESSGYMS